VVFLCGRVCWGDGRFEVGVVMRVEGGVVGDCLCVLGFGVLGLWWFRCGLGGLGGWGVVWRCCLFVVEWVVSFVFGVVVRRVGEVVGVESVLGGWVFVWRSWIVLCFGGFFFGVAGFCGFVGLMRMWVGGGVL